MNRYKYSVIILSLFLIQCVQKNKNVQSEKYENIPRSIASEKKLEFPKCDNPKANYLEKQILKLPFEFLHPQENHWSKTIPLTCIQFAQKNFKGAFAYCGTEEDKPVVGAPKPCLSENYTKLVYNAYHDVKNCFNLDPKNSFLQIMIESGFHINAINRTGFDAGIGQFTKNGILRVMDRNIVSRTGRLLLESSNPACARISGAFRDIQKDAFKIEKRCSMMALPQNPYRSLVLHYLHTMRDQSDLKRLLSTRIEIEPILNDEILEHLVYMAYNRGIQGTLRLVDGYIKSRKAVGAAITSEDMNLWKNLSRARSILKEEPRKRQILKSAKIKNLTFAEYAMIHEQNYLGIMAEASEIVKARVGEGCF